MCFEALGCSLRRKHRWPVIWFGHLPNKLIEAMTRFISQAKVIWVPLCGKFTIHNSHANCAFENMVWLSSTMLHRCTVKTNNLFKRVCQYYLINWSWLPFSINYSRVTQIVTEHTVEFSMWNDGAAETASHCPFSISSIHHVRIHRHNTMEHPWMVSISIRQNELISRNAFISRLIAAVLIWRSTIVHSNEWNEM